MKPKYICRDGPCFCRRLPAFQVENISLWLQHKKRPVFRWVLQEEELTRRRQPVTPSVKPDRTKHGDSVLLLGVFAQIAIRLVELIFHTRIRCPARCRRRGSILPRKQPVERHRRRRSKHMTGCKGSVIRRRDHNRTIRRRSYGRTYRKKPVHPVGRKSRS